MFHFVARSLVNRSKFEAQKAAFSQKSVIIDFLENESIFSQTKYAVICFTLRSIELENMGGIDFSAVATIF